MIDDFGSLILSRRIGESIKIVLKDGSLLSIKNVGIKGGQCKLLISAPSSVIIHREEIFNKILHDNNGRIPDSLYKEDENLWNK